MRRRRANALVAILISMIVVAVILFLVLLYLVFGQRGSHDNQQNGGTNNQQSNQQNNLNQQDYNGNGTSNIPVIEDPVTEPTQSRERSAYQISYQHEKVCDAAGLSQMADEQYEVSYDLNGDGSPESITLGIAYNLAEGKTGISISVNQGAFTESILERPLTSSSSVEIVGITNRSGTGIGAISRVFDESAGKYVLLVIVWEYENGELTEKWNMVYTGAAAPNGFMEDGYIYGKIRGEEVSYATDSHMNGYILNRSTLMSDMKNLGIYLPRDTTGECAIDYKDSVTGLVRIEVE